MPEQEHKFLQEMISSLKQQRDQLALKIHLCNSEIKDEWNVLEEKLANMTSDYDPLKHAVSDAGEGVWESMKLVGEEIKSGYERIRKSM